MKSSNTNGYNLLHEEIKMKKLIASTVAIIIAPFNKTTQVKKTLECNYSNNYYGDQQCKNSH